jgi:hypothetical protein
MASVSGHGRKLRKVEAAEPSESAGPAVEQKNPEESSVPAVLEFKGILTGLNPKTDMNKLPEDIFNAEANLTVEYLFGSLDGAPLVDAILEWFTDTTLENLPWYFSTGDDAPCRSIQRHPLSRKIQEKTVQLYKRRVAAEGLSQRVAGSGTNSGMVDSDLPVNLVWFMILRPLAFQLKPFIQVNLVPSCCPDALYVFEMR